MKYIIALAFIYGVIFAAVSQENDSSNYNRPFQASVFYPLGTNGLESPKYTNNVSFNLFYGLNGGLKGIEFGGLVNSNLGKVQGAQFAGIANINADKVNGAMFSGITNIAKDSSIIIAAAGISNVLGNSSYGLLAAGISNTTNGNFSGGQFAGITNQNNGAFIGGQFAGITNVNNGDMTGFQAAGISNINAGHLTGAQIGLINRSKKVTGAQIGLVNISDSIKGVPIGLINYVRQGYHSFEFYGSESIYANINFKLGVEKLYTIYKVGYFNNNGENYLTYGLGWGSMTSINDRIKLSLDLSANHIVQHNNNPDLDLLAKGDLNFRFVLNKYIDLFVGPSFNTYVAEYDVDSEAPLLNVPYTFYETDWWNGNGSTSIWIGANAGLGIRF
jgi:hypothetical protein